MAAVVIAVACCPCLQGCKTAQPGLAVYHNAEQYEGPGVYLFLVSDTYESNADPNVEERAFTVVLVNGTGDMLFVEDLREPTSLSVAAESMDQGASFVFSRPVLRWWYQPYLRIASASPVDIRRGIERRNDFGSMGPWNGQRPDAEMRIAVRLPNAAQPLQVRIDNRVVYSQLGEKFLNEIPLEFKFVLQPREHE